MGRAPARKAPTKAAPAKGRARKRIALVVGEFNSEITSEMERRAAERARELGYDPSPVLHVLGTYDLPWAVDAALQRKDVVAAVAIGAVVTGETGHDELIANATARTLQELMLRHAKPVGLGVTGPRQTYAQAEARLDRAEAAVEAVHRMLAVAAATRS